MQNPKREKAVKQIQKASYPKILAVQEDVSKQLLDRLAQETKGFLLFSIDGNGDVKINTNFDDSISAIALIEFARMWAENISEANQSQMGADEEEA